MVPRPQGKSQTVCLESHHNAHCKCSLLHRTTCKHRLAEARRPPTHPQPQNRGAPQAAWSASQGRVRPSRGRPHNCTMVPSFMRICMCINEYGTGQALAACTPSPQLQIRAQNRPLTTHRDKAFSPQTHLPIRPWQLQGRTTQRELHPMPTLASPLSWSLQHRWQHALHVRCLDKQHSRVKGQHTQKPTVAVLLLLLRVITAHHRPRTAA